MKKVALSLLSFALVGALAFAEDVPAVKFFGYVNTGIKIQKADAADWTFQEYANDYDAAGSWGKITAGISGANYGAAFTVKASDATLAGSTSGVALIDTAKAHFVPVTGLDILVGTGYSDAFDGIDDESDDNFWAGNGYGATYSIAGLTAGAHIGVPTAAGAPTFGFGAAYALDKVVAARASVKTNTKNEVTAYAASASLSAVPNLSLSGGYFATAVETDAVNALDVAASYAITPAFSAGVVAYDFLKAEYFTVKPNVSYKVTDAVTVSAYYKLYTEGKDKVTNYADNEIQAKVAYAVPGAGTLSAWVNYKTEKKVTTLQSDYVVSF